MFETTPVIKLGHFVRLTLLVMGVLTDCVHLPLIFRGSAILEDVQDFSSLIIFDVYFGRNVTLWRTVIVNERLRIDDPDGCTLENKLLFGNLDMIVSFDISEAIGLVAAGTLNSLHSV